MSSLAAPPRFRLVAGDGAPGPPFLREIARGARTVSVRLLRERDGSAEVVRTGRYPVTHWYPSTVRLALDDGRSWIAAAEAAELAGTPWPGEPYDARPGRAPSPLDRVLFGVRAAWRLAAAFIDELTIVTEWNVGVVAGGAPALLAGVEPSIRWFPPPAPETFIADPFVVERDGRRAVLVEQYDERRGYGVIDAIELDAGGVPGRVIRALDTGTHLSYPYPIEVDGELYIVPENAAGRRCMAYRCVAFPDRWEEAGPLLPLADALDTTIFAYEGRWWAMCTRYATGPNVTLYAYHAPHPLGPWTAHAANPIVSDIAQARPGGTPFVADGVVYRPAQDCSRTYGGALALARIDVLTPDAYRETIVRRIAPTRAFGRWSLGTHTLSCSANTDFAVLDGRRDVRSLAALRRRLPARLRALIARVVARRSQMR